MELYKNLIETSLENAEHYKSKINDDILKLEGMTGVKTRHFYNNLLNTDDARYLEIGTWKGSSVCSAMIGNKANVVCVDNWSEFGGPKSEFVSNFEKFKGDNNAIFIEENCFHLDIEKLPMKFNIYLYDGNHSAVSQYLALDHYYDCLDDTFIFIVDDWNFLEVRTGTKMAIETLKLKVLYEKEIRLTNDNSHTPEPLASQTWWNGLYVSVLQK
jgi:hypothetical protein